MQLSCLKIAPHVNTKIQFKVTSCFMVWTLTCWNFAAFLFLPVQHILDQYNLTRPNLNLHNYVIFDLWNLARDFKTEIVSKISNKKKISCENCMWRDYITDIEPKRTRTIAFRTFWSGLNFWTFSQQRCHCCGSFGSKAARLRNGVRCTGWKVSTNFTFRIAFSLFLVLGFSFL